MKTSTDTHPPTRRRQWLTISFIALGLLLIGFYGWRSVRSFNQMRYVREQGLDRGEASLDAIRPWMPIDYIAVAFAVPEEYIFSYLDIPFERRNQHQTLRDLNRTFDLGISPNGEYPLIIDQVQEAIEAYRANPVITGLNDIRDWMTLRYISVSTGVPEAYLMAELGIPMENDNVFKDLRHLEREHHHPNGLRGFLDEIEAIVANHEPSS